MKPTPHELAEYKRILERLVHRAASANSTLTFADILEELPKAILDNNELLETFLICLRGLDIVITNNACNTPASTSKTSSLPNLDQ